jgi:hypothetical protein
MVTSRLCHAVWLSRASTNAVVVIRPSPELYLQVSSFEQLFAIVTCDTTVTAWQNHRSTA